MMVCVSLFVPSFVGVQNPLLKTKSQPYVTISVTAFQSNVVKYWFFYY